MDSELHVSLTTKGVRVSDVRVGSGFGRPPKWSG